MFVKVTNGIVDQYPYTVGNLRRDNPNTSFPAKIPDETLNSFGVYSVTQEAAPSFDRRTQSAARAEAPVLEGGAWVLKWVVSNKTADEISAYDASIGDANRRTRNELLTHSDWTVLQDSPLSDAQVADWVVYRQALRDITSHANWPHLNKEDWPTQP